MKISIADIAKVCHGANKIFCERLGDKSQVAWVLAPAWQRESAIVGVKFNIKYPDAPASASHDSWLEEKRKAGWKYGKIKDSKMKEHPCFVPYEELPPEQQAKDHLFKGIVSSLSSLL